MEAFVCVRCGKCCRWKGAVKVADREVDAIADYLEIPVADFLDRYTVITPDRQALSLTERPDGACIFLDDNNDCIINAVKPAQCRDFPDKWNFPNWRSECPGGMAAGAVDTD